jgi:serine/threonine-protein kinase RsbW
VPDVELEIPSRSAYVAVVRLALASLARARGLDEELVDDIRIAASEACANAVMANEAAGVGAPVSVTWSERPDALVLEVSDRGEAREPAAAGEVDSHGFSTRSLMSYALVDALADECAMAARAGGGSTTRLVFRRS